MAGHFGVKHRTKINKKGGYALSEDQKYANTLNNRIRTLIDKGLISKNDVIATLGDIDGVELTAVTYVKDKDGKILKDEKGLPIEKGGFISTQTVFNDEMRKTLEQYISNPKNFFESKLYTKGHLLKDTVEDFYDVINGDLIQSEINRLMADGLMTKEDAERALGIEEIRDLMYDFGTAFRDGDLDRVHELRDQVIEKLRSDRYAGGVTYD